MTHMGGKAFVFGGPLVTGGGGAVTSFDLSTFGTLTRSTEASYLTSASAVSWASSNTIRLEDRGDGSGPMVLLEGSSANWLQYAESFVAPWTGGGTRTAAAVAGPDGTLVDRLNMASGNTGWYQFYTSYTGHSTHSSWVRAVSGTAFARRGNVTYGLVPLANCYAEATVGTTWQRLQFSYLESSGGTYAIVADARDWSSVGGAGATASDCYWDFTQVERLAFATSAMRNGASLFTRSADILSGAMSGVPSFFKNGEFSFSVSPVFSSAAGINHSADQCIFSFAEDDSERVYWYVSGGSIYVRVVSGGVEKVKSNALTFSAHQVMSVTVSASAGTVSVSGATSGNGTVTGTSWTPTPGPTLYVGARQGGTQNAYVRVGKMITR